jgi:hypothetical protein
MPESSILMCYTMYSIPNLFFVFVGGFVVNKYGSIVFFICILIAFFGQGIFCLGVLLDDYWLLLAGNFIGKLKFFRAGVCGHG